MKFATPFECAHAQWDRFKTHATYESNGMFRTERDELLLTWDSWKFQYRERARHNVTTYIGRDFKLPQLYCNGEKIPYSWVETERLCVDDDTGHVVAMIRPRRKTDPLASIPANFVDRQVAVYFARPGAAPVGAHVQLSKPAQISPNQARHRRDLRAQCQAWTALVGEPQPSVYTMYPFVCEFTTTFATMTNWEKWCLARKGFAPLARVVTTVSHLSLSQVES